MLYDGGKQGPSVMNKLKGILVIRSTKTTKRSEKVEKRKHSAPPVETAGKRKYPV